MPARVLVAGIGNIFLGDDGFGVEVARRLAGGRLGAHVVVEDFGIRGVHLALELASGAYDGAILVDAVSRGGDPGTLYAIEAHTEGEQDELQADVPPDAHSLTPSAVLAWVRRLGGQRGRILIVGCEPASLDESIGLSDQAAAAVDGAVRMVCDLASAMTGEPICA
jgi:hydrogenase maturation protease